MKIVIDIDDDRYEKIINNEVYAPLDICVALYNGTPLPKHHGRLIDYDDLIEQLDRYGRKNVKYQLPYSPTIIFADKESEK
jgi:hypothetical protein